jgi:hypothetical protein
MTDKPEIPDSEKPYDKTGVIGEWQAEEWIYFHFTAEFLADTLSLPLGFAEASLRQACASGEIRTIVSEAAEVPQEEPQPIPPSRWRNEEVDHTIPSNCLVGVCASDLEHWRDRQPKPCRGDNFEPYEWDFYGERWLYFNRAAIELGDKLAIPPSAAEAQLRKLCASGVIRAVGTNDPDERPEPIPPSEWPDDDLPRHQVLVSNLDFYNWLNRQAQPSTAGGKQSRIIRLLKEMFPKGVPSRDDCPRQPLTAALIKRDPSLSPLDPKTLKTAIDFYNRHRETLGNAGKL